MTKVRVTKVFHFEMAHALWNYDGACRNIHGHSYRLQVTLIGTPQQDDENPKLGMVMDFTVLKKLIKEPVVDFLDHSLAVYRKDEGELLRQVRQLYQKVHVFDFQPTCENLTIFISGKVQDLLPDGVLLHSVRLYETATSFTEWYLSDNL